MATLETRSPISYAYKWLLSECLPAYQQTWCLGLLLQFVAYSPKCVRMIVNTANNTSKLHIERMQTVVWQQLIITNYGSNALSLNVTVLSDINKSYLQASTGDVNKMCHDNTDKQLFILKYCIICVILCQYFSSHLYVPLQHYVHPANSSS